MDKWTKVKKISGIVFNSIWLGLAALLYFVGLNYYNESKAKGDGFGGWMMWGFMCAILIIIPIMKAVFTQTRKGAIEGANEYSASVQGNSIVVSNHPFRGAVIGFIGGCIGGLAVGPIIVPFYALKSVITIVKNILDLVSAKKSA